MPPNAYLPSVADAAEKVQPAVVSILVEIVTLNIFLQEVRDTGAGSGVILDPEGYILTNNHVVKDARQITVSLPDGRIFDAQLIGTDPLSDLAVVKIEGEELPTARFGNAKDLRIGEWVVAIGNALALPGGPTVTQGVVSARRSSITTEGGTIYDLLQTSAAINRGNSGGPLINLEGEVIGINTAMAGGEAQGIGFAISAATAQRVFQQLVAQGEVAWPYLGVSLYTVTPAVAKQFELSVTEGVLIAELIRGTPADQAGLQSGDVIVKFDGEDVLAADVLVLILRRKQVGDSVEITFVRGNQEQTVTATLVERPD